MLQRKFIEIFAKRTGYNTVKSGMSMLRKEDEEIKVLWDINIQCDNRIEARRPDLIVINKKEQKGIIIAIAVPTDVRIKEKKRKSGKVPGFGKKRSEDCGN